MEPMRSSAYLIALEATVAAVNSDSGTLCPFTLLPCTFMCTCACIGSERAFMFCLWATNDDKPD